MTKVVIVGGGVAGLAAARKLANSPRPITVTLIEAQSRLGGRVYTVKSKDGQLSFDLGASWFHDADNNPLYEVAKQKGWHTVFDDTSASLLTIGGEQISESTLAGHDSIMKGLTSHFNSKTVPDMSLKDFSLKYAATNLPSGPVRTLSPQVARMAELWTGMSWEEQSAAQFSGTEGYAHGRNAFNLDGNENVVNWLLSEIPGSVEIRLSQPVSKILPHSVTLESGEEISADYVVCTLPLGYMKANRESLFAKIPSEIDAVIQNGTMAALGKVVLTFEERWWVDEPRFLVVDPDGGCPVFFTNAYKFKAAPVLVALIAPPLTQVIEREPHKAFELLKTYLEALRIDPSRRVPIPNHIAPTDWTLNEYFLGSYSGVAVGQDEADLILPFYSYTGRIRFAGEHTSLEGAGCMHGAFASGEREADFILNNTGPHL